jgi:hypothetical protein
MSTLLLLANYILLPEECHKATLLADAPNEVAQKEHAK